MDPVRRFVILYHTGFGREHWDLMLEHGDSLLTWQLYAKPAIPLAQPISANRIGDHRKAYLEYEGPVRGDRGNVVRLDRGPLWIEELTAGRCVFHAAGAALNGCFELVAASDGWLLKPATQAGTGARSSTSNSISNADS